MLKALYPDEYLGSIYKIDYNRLLRRGIRALLFDLDNTIVPFDVPLPDEKISAFFTGLRDMGFKICIISNNKRERVERFNAALGLCMVWKAGKPKLNGVSRALSLMSSEPENTAFIGDQVFTDVFCGRRANMYTILVKPVSDRDELSVKLKRGPEALVIKSYLRRLKNDGN